LPLQDTRGIHQWSERMINLGRLVHRIHSQPR